MAAPLELMLEFLDAVEKGRAPSDEVTAWLHDGLSRFVAGEAATICGALRLRGVGQALPGQKIATQARNEALRRAYDLTPAPKLPNLLHALRRFEGTTWPRVRDATLPPSSFDERQRALFDVFRAGIRVPCSERQLRRVIALKSDTKCRLSMSGNRQ